VITAIEQMNGLYMVKRRKKNYIYVMGYSGWFTGLPHTNT